MDQETDICTGEQGGHRLPNAKRQGNDWLRMTFNFPDTPGFQVELRQAVAGRPCFRMFSFNGPASDKALTKRKAREGAAAGTPLHVGSLFFYPVLPDPTMLRPNIQLFFPPTGAEPRFIVDLPPSVALSVDGARDLLDAWDSTKKSFGLGGRHSGSDERFASISRDEYMQAYEELKPEYEDDRKELNEALAKRLRVDTRSIYRYQETYGWPQ